MIPMSNDANCKLSTVNAVSIDVKDGKEEKLILMILLGFAKSNLASMYSCTLVSPRSKQF